MTFGKILWITMMSAVALFGSVAEGADVQGPKIGLVNFKSCVEKSKMGKQEQAQFEGLKKQMEQIMEEKEKTLTEISKKLSDQDYLDSLSQEAEAELKHKFRSQNQEMAQHQQQYYQVLNQANYKILQKISDVVGEASKKVAEEKRLDLVINDEGTFFHNQIMDVSDDVVKIMDELYEKSPQKK